MHQDLDLAKLPELKAICQNLKCYQVTSRSIITRCIYCGDSQRKLENYGHFYIFRHAPVATCFRCGITVSLKKWLKDLALEIPQLENEVTNLSKLLSYTFNSNFSSQGLSYGNTNQKLYDSHQKILTALNLKYYNKEENLQLVLQVIENRIFKETGSYKRAKQFVDYLTFHFSQALNEYVSVVQSTETKELYFAIFGFNEVLLRKLSDNLHLMQYQTLKTFGWPHFTPLFLTLGYEPVINANVIVVENFFDCLAASYFLEANTCLLTHGKRNLVTTLYAAIKLFGQRNFSLYLVADKDSVDFTVNQFRKSFLNKWLKRNFSEIHLVVPYTEDLWQDFISNNEFSTLTF